MSSNYLTSVSLLSGMTMDDVVSLRTANLVKGLSVLLAWWLAPGSLQDFLVSLTGLANRNDQQGSYVETCLLGRLVTPTPFPMAFTDGDA